MDCVISLSVGSKDYIEVTMGHDAIDSRCESWFFIFKKIIDSGLQHVTDIALPSILGTRADLHCPPSLYSVYSILSHPLQASPSEMSKPKLVTSLSLTSCPAPSPSSLSSLSDLDSMVVDSPTVEPYKPEDVLMEGAKLLEKLQNEIDALNLPLKTSTLWAKGFKT